MQQITGHTLLTGLLGSPVSQSISPMMHNTSFQELGIDYVYLAFDVNADHLKTAMEGLKALGVKGFNLTMPNKILMCELVDKLSPAAKMIGAVNTVVNQNGILTGHNTDGIGYMKSVMDAGYHILEKKMTLLGAGGAATAILVQAALDGVSAIDIFSIRDPFFERAKHIIDSIHQNTSCKVTLYDLLDTTSLKQSIKESTILTNATSVGMNPNPENSPITDPSFLHKDLIVSDIIYSPKETKLLKMAREQHLPVFNGMFMLLYQGAEAFRLWTGQEMPIDLIKEKYFNPLNKSPAS